MPFYYSIYKQLVNSSTRRLLFRVNEVGVSDVPLKDHKASQYYDFWERIANGSFEVTRHFIEAIHNSEC